MKRNFSSEKSYLSVLILRCCRTLQHGRDRWTRCIRHQTQNTKLWNYWLKLLEYHLKRTISMRAVCRWISPLSSFQTNPLFYYSWLQSIVGKDEYRKRLEWTMEWNTSWREVVKVIFITLWVGWNGGHCIRDNMSAHLYFLEVLQTRLLVGFPFRKHWQIHLFNSTEHDLMAHVPIVTLWNLPAYIFFSGLLDLQTFPL